MPAAPPHFTLEATDRATILRLQSPDNTNRLTSACVLSLTQAIHELAPAEALVIAGNREFFSAGADLSEIAALTGPAAYKFSQMGQALMRAIECFPVPVFAAIEGYCMGGGLDLALACHRRIASSSAVFGHRGAALGLITGWGGTQRLPRLIGKARALQIFGTAEKIPADSALRMGLVDLVAPDPVRAALESIVTRHPLGTLADTPIDQHKDNPPL